MTIVDKIRYIVLEYELDSVAVASEGMRIYLDFCLSRHVRDFSCLFFNLWIVLSFDYRKTLTAIGRTFVIAILNVEALSQQCRTITNS